MSPEPRAVTPRQRFGWYLYDFADSVLIFNGLLYFPKWIVVESGAGELSYNAAIALTTVLLLLTAPLAGYLSDVRYGRLPFLRVIALAMGGSAVAIYLSGIVFPAGSARTLVALGAFGVLLYGHQLSSTFYNALLPRVGAPGSYFTIAGTGFVYRRAGAVIGILALLPFGSGRIRLLADGPPEPFLLAAVLYAVLTTVSLSLIPDDLPQGDDRDGNLKAMLGGLWRDLVLVRADRRLSMFLLAYVLFMDAILTVENNVTLYMDRVMHLEDHAKAILLLGLLVASAAGAKAGALFAVSAGLKSTFTTILAGWTIVLASISASTHPVLVVGLLATVAALYGALSTCARATYLLIIPSARRAEYLGIYASFERCASITGPIAWGATVWLFGVPAGYRVALLVMAGLIAVSVPLVRAMELPSSNEAV
jgi:UMF1 family MFS transporter